MLQPEASAYVEIHLKPCLIFFDWHGDGTRDHVGIVEKCDGKRVYTIEGNSSDQVARRSYPVGYYEILGYGIVKF